MKTLVRATVLVVMAYFVVTYILNPVAASFLESANIIGGL